jgi:PAS domain S-box-containing protein
VDFNIKSLTDVGVTPEMNRLESGRVRLINSFALMATIACIVFVPILFAEGLIVQPIFVSITAILFGLNLIFSLKGFHRFSRFFFIVVGTSLTCALSLNAFSQGLFTDTENMIYGFMAVSILLFSGYHRHIFYWLLFAIVMTLKYVKVNMTFENADLGFIITLQNSFILGLILYLLLMAFFTILSKSLEDVVIQEKTLFSLIDHVPLFLALIDTDRKYLIVNQKYVDAFGKPRHEIIGTNSKDILPKNIWEAHSPYIERAIKGESPVFLNKTELPDGSFIYTSGRYVPIMDPVNNSIKLIALYVDDVTELKDAEEQLKRELKDKDKLFSIIAHDIRSPLNLFEGLLNASDSQVISQEEFLVFKEKLRERFISLQETINGLLEWSRLQLDRIQPVPIYFEPRKVITELINVFKPIAESKEIEISQTGESQEVKMDINHFRIIFRNLLHNALKFTPNGGRIDLKYEFSEANWLITITDTGVGMSQESIDKVLAKEEVTSATGTLGESGTGLGLHLSLELLEKNCGELSIVRNNDAGTTFAVQIPTIKSEVSQLA